MCTLHEKIHQLDIIFVINAFWVVNPIHFALFHVSTSFKTFPLSGVPLQQIPFVVLVMSSEVKLFKYFLLCVCFMCVLFFVLCYLCLFVALFLP
jgi:hypothetical protein